MERGRRGPVEGQAVFRVLGPLRVELAGSVVPLPAGKLRSLLAVLLVRAGRTVTVRELAEGVWGGAPPADPRGTVQKYVMRLRRILAATGAVISTELEGYRLDVPPGRLDLHRFDELVRSARAAADAGDPAGARLHLAEALALWRAVPPLADVASEALRRGEVARLAEQHLHVLEQRIQLDLRLGRTAGLESELRELVRRHPLRERLWAQLVRVQLALGRPDAAARTYDEAARLLAEEVGVDPGPDMRAVYEQLRGAAVEGAAPAGVVLPLPSPAAVAVEEREAEIRAVVDALGADRGPDAPRLVVVTGPAGSGKTAVALHAAHRLAPHYPDGQLLVRCASGPPDLEVLASVLRALGVPPVALPTRRADAIGALRSHTADRSLLFVLDGVERAETVQALLPGSTSCAVLVTSRTELPELLVRPGGLRVGLAARG